MKRALWQKIEAFLHMVVSRIVHGFIGFGETSSLNFLDTAYCG